MKDILAALEDIVSNEEIEKVWGRSDFGSMRRREVIKYGLLECVAGYKQGKTAQQIITELGLITEKYRITKKGRQYLWEAFSNESKL